MAKRTRRQFLTDAARTAAGLSAVAASGCFPNVGGSWAQQRLDCDAGQLPLVTGPSRVVHAFSEAAVSVDPATFRTTINDAAVEGMLGRILTGLAGGDGQPWSVLLPDCSAATRVGIKVNTLNADCPTSVPLVRALVTSLRSELGLPAEQVVVWDRSASELARAGFTSESVGGTVLGTNELSNGGYEGSYCTVNGKMTRLSRILTELTDVTINCPVLKTHEVSGITGALKNVYGVIDNPEEFHTGLTTELPAIYAIVPVRSRIQLTVIDALVAITAGGTSSPVDTVPKRIFASQDPIAADSYALALVNQLRAGSGLGMTEIDPAKTSWLARAQSLGLGALAYDLLTV